MQTFKQYTRQRRFGAQVMLCAVIFVLAAPFTAFADPEPVTSQNAPPGGSRSTAVDQGGNNSATGGAGGSGSAVGSAAGGAIGCTAGFLSGLTGLLSNAGAVVAVPTNDIPTGTVVAPAATSDTVRENFLNCIARTAAKALLQKVTASTVNWINSGFKGSPSFVQNYQQFFSDVADQVAGQFIQGSDLAFLCSPFQLQIRIAIAHTYAGYSETPSCTLSGVVQNINGFMNNFSNGGWIAMETMTTNPTNNPFGAFMYANTALQLKTAGATGKKTLDLGLGQGFLSTTEDQNCTNYSDSYLTGSGIGSANVPDTNGKSVTDNVDANGQHQGIRVCDQVNVTPGTAIQDSLDNALGTNFRSLETAKYFDEIISALISQLVTQVLQNGLSTVSSGSGYGSNNYAKFDTSQLSQTVQQNAPGYKAAAQQLIDIDNQNISRLQSSIGPLQSLSSCWKGIVNSNSTFFTADMKSQATNNAATADSAIASLQGRIAGYQTKITSANATISSLDQYQSSAGGSDSGQLISTVSSFESDAAGGVFPNSGSVSDAQSSQTSLQSELSTLDTNSQTSLAQCQALVASSTAQH